MTTEDTGIAPLEDADLLTEMVRALVDHPEAVRVDEQTTDTTVMLVVHTAASDRGKVIGKNGLTISAIRTYFGRVTAIEGKRVFIEVADSKPGRKEA